MTLACTPAVGVPRACGPCPSRYLPRLLAEFEAARRQFGLSAEAPMKKTDDTRIANSSGSLGNTPAASIESKVAGRARRTPNDLRGLPTQLPELRLTAGVL